MVGMSSIHEMIHNCIFSSRFAEEWQATSYGWRYWLLRVISAIWMMVFFLVWQLIWCSVWNDIFFFDLQLIWLEFWISCFFANNDRIIILRDAECSAWYWNFVILGWWIWCCWILSSVAGLGNIETFADVSKFRNFETKFRNDTDIFRGKNFWKFWKFWSI